MVDKITDNLKSVKNNRYAFNAKNCNKEILCT